MLSRTYLNVMLVLAAISVVTVALFTVVLPLLGAVPSISPLEMPLWSFLAPLLGGAATGALLYGRIRRARLTHSAEAIADLPAQSFLLFNFAVILAVGAGLLVEDPSPIFQTQPLLVTVCLPALTLTMSIFLRFFIQFPLAKEMQRLHQLGVNLARQARTAPRPGIAAQGQRAGGPASRAESSRAWDLKVLGLGVLEIQPTITLTALSLAAITLALIGVYTFYSIHSTQEKQIRVHLEDLLRVSAAQARLLPEEQLASFFATYPASLRGTPVLLGPKGRTLTPGAGLPAGARLSLEKGFCRARGQRFNCATSALGGGRVLAVLQTSKFLDRRVATSERVWSFLPLTALFLLFSGFLGRAIGKDISKDFETMARQLRAMSQQDQLELGRPVTVTSIDEVGDLTAALGKLRGRLECELQEYRESLKQAQEADHLKNMFFSDVSHELRTPLTSICGYSQLLLEDDLTTTHKDDVRIINKSGKVLLNLINDVIDISVIESGHLKLNLEKVDLAALCSEIVEEQRPIAKRRQELTRGAIELELKIEGPIPAILGDPLRLRQIIQNLLSNAIKFTDKGSVTLSLAMRGEGEVVISVADTGAGISAGELAHIFERYRQTGNVRSQQQGSGLGLGICHHLVTLHGGKIFAESEVDNGSTFTIELPVAPRDSEAAGALRPGSADPEPDGGEPRP